ncbi:molybdenum cofactor guanylyltransferase [Virgibacillus doumboii]|uniref:molybdenum cofactor guanylyltransferase n=1 Tax=Virgibacillus doumboii TaxID=2697503 RepID=UPI0013DF104A|nr:molybdenum cofactor guanylyltransferase [Virgibacillus doumboii]
MNICGVVLTGGESSRMGTNKSLLTLTGKPVIEHITTELKTCSNSVSVITNDPPSYKFLGTNLYADRYPGKGPLAGLESAIYHGDASVYLCAACDMPFVSKEVYNYLLNALQDFDAVIPVYNKKLHPLSGIYTNKILPKIQQQLDNDERKVRGLFDHISVNYISTYGNIPENVLTRHFFNMNYPDQYESAKLL